MIEYERDHCMNGMDGKIKLVCGSCETIFYMLTDKSQCPECYEMVDPRAGFNLTCKSRKNHPEDHKDKHKGPERTDLGHINADDSHEHGHEHDQDHDLGV